MEAPAGTQRDLREPREQGTVKGHAGKTRGCCKAGGGRENDAGREGWVSKEKWEKGREKCFFCLSRAEFPLIHEAADLFQLGMQPSAPLLHPGSQREPWLCFLCHFVLQNPGHCSCTWAGSAPSSSPSHPLESQKREKKGGTVVGNGEKVPLREAEWWQVSLWGRGSAERPLAPGTNAPTRSHSSSCSQELWDRESSLFWGQGLILH